MKFEPCIQGSYTLIQPDYVQYTGVIHAHTTRLCTVYRGHIYRGHTRSYNQIMYSIQGTYTYRGHTRSSNQITYNIQGTYIQGSYTLIQPDYVQYKGDITICKGHTRSYNHMYSGHMYIQGGLSVDLFSI